MKPAATAHGARGLWRAARARAFVLSALAALVAPDALAQLKAPSAMPPTGAAARADADGPAAATSPLAQLLARARRMIDDRRAEAAFRSLQARVADYGGDPDFDYLLGLAALDSGHPGEAVIALERVLMVRPGFLQARAEIARAYFALRERENARREFEIVAAQRIPDEARRVIGRYLDAIRSIDDAARSTLVGLVELETGYDSNVNFGSSTGQWVLADGTAVIPLGISLPRNSSVFASALGLNWSVPMGGGWQWTTGGRASLRRYPSAHTLDQDQFDLSSGFAFRTGCHQFNMLAQFQHLQLGGAAFRNALGALGQWQCDLDARTQVGAYVQGFSLDFPEEPMRDARRSAVGLTFARVLDGARRPIVVAGAQVGNETSRRDLDNLSYDFFGARAALSMGMGGGWRGFAALSWEARNFDGVEPIFGVARRDRQTEVRFGAERALTADWSVAPAVTFTRNRSTLDPNDFRRTQAGVTLRYRFQ
jgi:tetratricopeptide (TPR) repeat protein